MIDEQSGQPQSEQPPSKAWEYQPALDGIRALAVVAVVLFHFWQGTFTGGFIGVDMFFVLSGYLITGILLAEQRATGGVALRAFWQRRFRRLVPAVLVLVALSTVGSYIAGGWSARQFADSIGALTWTTNIVETTFGSSHLLMRNSDTVLDHLWSLAIEEQFYLVWPPVLGLLVARVASLRGRIGFVVAAIAASATVMGVGNIFTVYFRTDARAFELLIGALIALAAVRLPQRWSSPVALLSLAGLGWFVGNVETGDAWMYPWGFLIVASLAAMLVLAATNPSPSVTAVLASKPFAVVGQRSYGVYLWHIPVYRILSEAVLGFGGPGLLAVRLLSLVVLVEASFRFVEQPIRSGRVKFSPCQWGAAYLSVCLILVPVGKVAHDEWTSQWDSTSAPPDVRPGQTKVVAIGDVLGLGTLAAVARSEPYALWQLVDASCPTVLVGQFWRRDTPFLVTDECRHWVRRNERAVERFRPDVVTIGFGVTDTMELRIDDRRVRAPELGEVYRTAIQDQIRSVGPGRIVMIRVDDVSNLLDPADGATTDRLAASAEYLRAFDEVVADRPDIDVLRVDGAPTLDEYIETVARQIRPLLGGG